MCGSRPALFFAGEERVHPAENKEAGGLDTLVAGVDVRRMRTRKTTEIELETQEWSTTERIIVKGASHFFVGRTDQVVELTSTFLLAR